MKGGQTKKIWNKNLSALCFSALCFSALFMK